MPKLGPYWVEIIRTLEAKVESLENRVIQLELARLEAMGDEDIDCSDIPETTEEEFVGALRGVFYGDSREVYEEGEETPWEYFSRVDEAAPKGPPLTEAERRAFVDLRIAWRPFQFIHGSP